MVKGKIIAAILIMALTLSGCGKEKNPSTQEATSETLEQSEEKADIDTLETTALEASKADGDEEGALTEGTNPKVGQTGNEAKKVEKSGNTSSDVNEIKPVQDSDSKTSHDKKNVTPKENTAETPTGNTTTNNKKNTIPESSNPKPAPHTSCSWDSGKVTASATCDSEGEKTYSCTVCGKTKSESIGRNSHNYTTETKAATCNEPEKVKTYCTICGTVQSETTGAAATGHTMIDSWFGDAPTCTNGGYLNRYCTKCDYLEVSTSVPPLEHNKVSEQSDYQNGCEKIITTKYYCSDCGCELGKEHSYEYYHTWISDEEGTYCSVCFDTP